MYGAAETCSTTAQVVLQLSKDTARESLGYWKTSSESSAKYWVQGREHSIFVEEL